MREALPPVPSRSLKGSTEEAPSCVPSVPEPLQVGDFPFVLSLFLYANMYVNIVQYPLSFSVVQATRPAPPVPHNAAARVRCMERASTSPALLGEKPETDPPSGAVVAM